MITIGQDFIGIGRIVDYSHYYESGDGTKIQTPVRIFEFGINNRGFWIVKQTSLCKVDWFRQLSWLWLLLISIIVNCLLAAIIIFKVI